MFLKLTVFFIVQELKANLSFKHIYCSDEFLSIFSQYFFDFNLSLSAGR